MEKGVKNMTNVSSRARTVKQPRGGYINPKLMERVQFEDGITLSRESIAPVTMGMIVDYLTRMDQGSSPEDAFHIGLRGAEMAGREEEGKGYVKGIKGLDDESINNACRIVWFDQVVRAGRIGDGEPTDTFADPETCENVRTMVARARAFFEKYGPVVEDAPTFMGGYTKPSTLEMGTSLPRIRSGISRSQRTCRPRRIPSSWRCTSSWGTTPSGRICRN